MKKLTKLAIVTSALALNLSAQNVIDYHIGVSSAKVLDKDFTELNIGYGFNIYTQNDFYVGLVLGFAFGNVDLDNSKTADVFGTNADLKLGYSMFDNDLALYAIGSGALQSVDTMSGAGFGYGAGVDYRFSKNFALNIEYKTYDMTSDKMPDYTYEKINTNFKYTF
jgi:opacity protein-like surface antigen